MKELIFELSSRNRRVVTAAMVANDYSISGWRVADDHQHNHTDEKEQNSRHISRNKQISCRARDNENKKKEDTEILMIESKEIHDTC